jgi:hypothetical protein
VRTNAYGYPCLALSMPRTIHTHTHTHYLTVTAIEAISSVDEAGVGGVRHDDITLAVHRRPAHTHTFSVHMHTSTHQRLQVVHKRPAHDRRIAHHDSLVLLLLGQVLEVAHLRGNN